MSYRLIMLIFWADFLLKSVAFTCYDHFLRSITVTLLGFIASAMNEVSGMHVL